MTETFWSLADLLSYVVIFVIVGLYYYNRGYKDGLQANKKIEGERSK